MLHPRARSNFLLKIEAQVGSEEEQMRVAERYPELADTGQLTFESLPALLLSNSALRLRFGYGRSPSEAEFGRTLDTIRCPAPQACPALALRKYPVSQPCQPGPALLLVGTTSRRWQAHARSIGAWIQLWV